MNHSSDDLLNRYLDRDLDEAAHQALERHLDACPDCRERLTGLQLVFDLLATLPEQPLERDLVPQVLTVLPSHRLRLVWRLGLALQSAVAFGALLALLSQFTLFARHLDWGHVLQTGSARVTLAWSGLLNHLANIHLTIHWPTPNLPTLQIPQLAFPTITHPNLQMPQTILIVLVLASGLLWLVGNLTLLRPHRNSEAE